MGPNSLDGDWAAGCADTILCVYLHPHLCVCINGRRRAHSGVLCVVRVLCCYVESRCRVVHCRCCIQSVKWTWWLASPRPSTVALQSAHSFLLCSFLYCTFRPLVLLIQGQTWQMLWIVFHKTVQIFNISCGLSWNCMLTVSYNQIIQVYVIVTLNWAPFSAVVICYCF